MFESYELYEDTRSNCKIFCFSGHRKRDELQAPVTRDSIHIPHLHHLASFFMDWKDSKRPGLTSQTFLACQQTFKALAQLCEYLLHHKDFDYVLLGKFSSDTIEGRFGCYRQLSGGNFFISIKQILESEKKIRKLNLMELRMLEEAAVDSHGMSQSHTFVGNYEWLSEKLPTVVSISSINEDSVGIIHYVAGSIGRSVSRVHK